MQRTFPENDPTLMCFKLYADKLISFWAAIQENLKPLHFHINTKITWQGIEPSSPPPSENRETVWATHGKNPSTIESGMHRARLPAEKRAKKEEEKTPRRIIRTG